MPPRRYRLRGPGGPNFSEFHPAPTVSARRTIADRTVQELSKGGRTVAPIRIEGRQIAATFWGRAWCENLEAYSDFASRLPRGRSYVRSGAVVDLQIAETKVSALVQGTSLYRVELGVQALAKDRWERIARECAGSVDSVVSLLAGGFPEHVMKRVTEKGEGLFPAPKEIELDCSCPDWATMCKHVAAVMYGIGARLDAEPALLFVLRGVDPRELTSEANVTAVLTDASLVDPRKRLEVDDLSALFGIELETEPGEEVLPEPRRKGSRRKKRR